MNLSPGSSLYFCEKQSSRCETRWSVIAFGKVIYFYANFLWFALELGISILLSFEIGAHAHNMSTLEHTALYCSLIRSCCSNDLSSLLQWFVHMSGRLKISILLRLEVYRCTEKLVMFRIGNIRLCCSLVCKCNEHVEWELKVYAVHGETFKQLEVLIVRAT